MALAASVLGTESEAKEAKVQSPWGGLSAEARERGVLLASTPRHEVSERPVMLLAACRRLGLDPGPVEATGAEMRVVDVGRSVLVVPFEDEASLDDAPEDADVSGVPGHEVEEAVGYVHTQSTPYARILARSWDAPEPLAGLAAASLHLVTSGIMRPTYPRTRVVASLVDEEGEAEVTVQARKAGGSPVVERLLVGGRIEALEG